jgi:PAS domain S-box-containing protein
MAARLLGAPMAAVTLVGRDEQFFAGSHGLPLSLTSGGRASIAYSVCKYIVIRDHPASCGDMLHDESRELREHLLLTEYGIRAFLGVPVRDTADRLVGSMTVLDTAVRQWTDDELATLLEIAELLRPPGIADAVADFATLDSSALLDSVQEAFLAVNPDGVVVGFNRAAQDLLGYAPAEVCGRHLDDDLLPDYDGQPIAAALDRVFTAGTARPVLRQVSVRRRDGRRLTVAASLSVVRGAAGALACVFLTDLSQQSAAEELAERNSGFLAALLDSLSVGVVACDHAGQVVVMNRALRETQGLPATGPLPATAAWVLHDAGMRQMPWERTPLMRAFRGERVDAVDLLTKVPGERVRIFATTAQPILAGDGRQLGAVAVAHEVTAMRRAEQFRACHLAVQEVMRSANTEAGAAPGVLRAIGTALGWPCAELFLIEEATGQLRSAGHWDASGHDVDGFFGDAPIRGAGVTGRVWQTGRAVWVADIADSPDLRTRHEQAAVQAWLRRGIRTALAVPVRDGGTLLGVLTCYAGAHEVHEELLTVLLDGVAAQIGVYVALRRAEQLARQLTRAQDDFIALVGHEMRTPLTSIVANVTMLDEDAGTLDADHRLMLRSVARNAATLRATLDKLLDLAGLDSGYLSLTPGSVDLAAVVTQAVATARHAAAEIGVLLHTDLPPRLRVGGDAGRLRQVVDDLLCNAVRYSPLGGQVHIELRADQDMAELLVVDCGIGTPAEERDRVFDRFFRGSNVRHQGTAGSGLGLSLARAIVRLHGGMIQLTANEPIGTVVRVRLPLPITTVPPARPP